MVEHIYSDFNECYWDDLWYFFKKGTLREIIEERFGNMHMKSSSHYGKENNTPSLLS